MIEGQPLALQVCLNCKTRKRKCDKTMPSCSLCTKLLIKCDYQYIPSQLRSGEAQQADQSSRLPISHSTGLTSAAKLFSDLSEIRFRSIPSEASVTSQVLALLVADGESVLSLMSTFFRTIDTWLPIIDPEQFRKRVESIILDNDVELACLLLAMYLITSLPSTEYGGARSTLYYQTKTLQSALVSSGNPSTDVVKSGLLIAIYEQGHDFSEAAQITMSSSSRMAAKLLMNAQNLTSKNIQNSDIGRLWWAILMIESFINLGVPPNEILLTSSFPRAGPLLISIPNDDEVPIRSSKIELTSSGIIAANRPTTRLGPFCRAAEGAQLLGKVQQLIAGSAWDHEIDVEAAERLNESLQNFAMSLVQQAVNGWEECCAAIGLCFSALFALHLRIMQLYTGIYGAENLVQAAGMTLKSTTRMIIDISGRFRQDLAFIDVPALPLLSTFALYQAALLHIQFADRSFLSEEWLADMESLKVTLAHFSRRWTVGKSYPAKIDNAIAAEVRKKAQSEDVVMIFNN